MAAKTTYLVPLIAVLMGTTSSAAAGPKPLAHPRLTAGSARVQSGYTVVGPSGAEWSIPGGPKVSASPGSLVRVVGAPQPLTLHQRGTTPGYTVLLKAGRIDIQVPQDSKSAVIVATPRRLDAIVRSGTARAVVSGADAAVANDRGETLTAQSGGAFRALPEGMVRTGGEGARALVASPTAVQGPRVFFAKLGEVSVSDLSWNDVQGARGYHVELAKKGENRPLAAADTRSPRLERPVAELGPGAYEMRLSALDASGLQSATLRVPVRVVAAELPPGAYLDLHGAIRLGKGQRVQFSGTEGLEMTYGNGEGYVKAVGTAGLLGGEATAVHFRLPGTYEVATARLAPRTERALIEIGPARATWPKDPISIRVKLEDPSAAVPEWLELVPKVTVGLEPVDAHFEKSGQWLVGRVEPRHGGGPWVVRVEVEDQFGTALGRDFIEVIHRAKPEKRRNVVRREAKP